MQHQHGAVAEHEQQEQALRHVEPAGHEQRDVHRVNRNQCQRMPDVAHAEHKSVAERAPKRVLEPRLQRPHPFETDQPYDRQREFRNQQRRDLQHDPRVDAQRAGRAENQPVAGRFREIRAEGGEIVARRRAFAGQRAAGGVVAGGQRRADRNDRNTGDEHQNVDPDRVDGVAQAAHKAGIGGEELHNRLSYGIRIATYASRIFLRFYSTHAILRLAGLRRAVDRVVGRFVRRVRLYERRCG